MRYFKTKMVILTTILIVLWSAILSAPAKAHDIPESNFYQCGTNEITIDNRYVTIRGWKMEIVPMAKFKADFKRKNQATFEGHLIFISFNVGSTLNNPDYYVVNRENLTYYRTRTNGKQYNGSCLVFKH